MFSFDPDIMYVTLGMGTICVLFSVNIHLSMFIFDPDIMYVTL